jgi:DNA-binding transcriptional LysR family regulator
MQWVSSRIILLHSLFFPGGEWSSIVAAQLGRRLRIRLCVEPHMVDSFDWNALQSFLAVARAGRLTVAARQLGVDHSTLSRRIVALEEALQARLFDRRTNGYTLTSQGERLLESAQAMESVALTVLSEIAGARLQVAGTVRIGAPDGFGTSFLAPRLGRLGAQHPDLVVQLVTMPRLFSLSKREADLAIGLTRPEEGRLHARKLADYELGLYGSRDYLAAHGPVRDEAELQGHRFIGYIEDLIYAPELDYLPLVSREIRPLLTSSNLLAQFSATVAGSGLCVLPCFLADPEPRLGRVLSASVALIRSFWLIVHTDMRDLARVRIAAEFIAQEVRAARGLFLPGLGQRAACSPP